MLLVECFNDCFIALKIKHLFLSDLASLHQSWVCLRQSKWQWERLKLPWTEGREGRELLRFNLELSQRVLRDPNGLFVVKYFLVRRPKWPFIFPSVSSVVMGWSTNILQAFIEEPTSDSLWEIRFEGRRLECTLGERKRDKKANSCQLLFWER